MKTNNEKSGKRNRIECVRKREESEPRTGAVAGVRVIGLSGSHG